MNEEADPRTGEEIARRILNKTSDSEARIKELYGSIGLVRKMPDSHHRFIEKFPVEEEIKKEDWEKDIASIKQEYLFSK